MSSAIAIDSLSFGYNKINVLDELSVSVEEGKLTCLLGSNGAGKTTLINLILGRLTNSKGSIELFGKEQDIAQVKMRIGAMLQNSTAPERAKVGELVDLFSSYYPTPFGVKKLMLDLGLNNISDKRFGKLSGGQKQLVLLALALCGDPDLLFLDEPSVGMDVEVRRTLWKVIESLKARGKTIVLTTHYLEEADALADRVVVLQQGKIIADGTPEQIKSKFQNKKIKAKTSQSLSWLNALPDVISSITLGQYVEVISKNTESTLKKWLNNDQSLADITVITTDLEQAFLQITSSKNSSSQDTHSQDTSTQIKQSSQQASIRSQL
jgi:ABC-2 type transport system ATP-binding protein